MIRACIYLIFILFFLTSCTENGTEDGNSGSSSGIIVEKYLTGLTDQEKLALAIARKNELRTIRKGDYMTLKNNPEQAIIYYISALEKLPNDITIKRRIAHTYYLLKDWKNAYNYYSSVPVQDLNDNEKNELFQSLLFDDTRSDQSDELIRYEMSSNDSDYYGIITTCYTNIHNCIVAIEAYTGTSEKIISLEKTIIKSKQISPDYQYRNFLVAAQFYESSMYRVVDIMTNEILSNRPNYHEIRKLRGFALYELGKYTQSRDLLLNYLAENPKDVETIVKLGDIYMSLGDFVNSSLYFNNAVSAGYTNKAEIERRLAYNYSALNDNASMLKVLRYLLQEPDVTEDDFAVAISLALYQGENIRAYAWAYAGIQKYKNSNILTPLYLSALRLNGKFKDTIEYVSTLPEDMRSNPLIQLEYAIAFHESGDNDTALSLFTSISQLDDTSDWSKEALEYIGIIETIQANSGSLQINNE